MPVLLVHFPRERKKGEAVLMPLFWYDIAKQKMIRFEATRLEFKYAYDEELEIDRLMPHPVIETPKQQEAPLMSVIKWYRDYANYNSSKMLPFSRGKDSRGILFDVPDEEVDAVLYDLERNNLRGDII